ncbi:MAG: hypothetical protein AAFQ53_00090 [Bacteroidota bacterium]
MQGKPAAPPGDGPGHRTPPPATPTQPARTDKGDRRDVYLGRSQYKRRGRGVVKKVSLHLAMDVATALKVAAAEGDENGANMGEIVETLLRKAGYGSAYPPGDRRA